MVHPRELRRVRSHLARIRPDLVHTHLSTSGFFGGMVARSLGIPSVTPVHAD
jgi:glycosyl transferase family 4